MTKSSTCDGKGSAIFLQRHGRESTRLCMTNRQSTSRTHTASTYVRLQHPSTTVVCKGLPSSHRVPERLPPSLLSGFCKGGGDISHGSGYCSTCSVVWFGLSWRDVFPLLSVYSTRRGEARRSRSVTLRPRRPRLLRVPQCASLPPNPSCTCAADITIRNTLSLDVSQRVNRQKAKRSRFCS
ncbi:hypothetical protein BCV70DRAFT_53382 [Testicularia cyperi]|uniref:Uncharacterized protein n=1 Tax=Testicularia cyperi TaxID=1882483 RepID=A0A317XVI1_9BASI|nr:hypothetical protein BCV70DRAFT_53382 [Testicularia cyperi]